MKKLARILGFASLTALLFLSALAGAAHVRYGGYTLLQALTHNYVEPGGRFQSLRRFREAQERGRVDIAFLGPSRAYRGFDPRLFEAQGWSAMNLGSTAQTPLNSYYLAGRYLAHLAPRLVVFEVSYSALENDGLESCFDLIANTPWSWSTERMAISTWNLGAFSFAAAKGLGVAGDESSAVQREAEGETYIPGGYCETRGQRSARFAGAVTFDIKRKQVEYLGATSVLARSLGAHVLWVSMPVPSDYLQAIRDRAAIARELTAEAARLGITYWDLNGAVDLDPMTDFYDALHLNADGVAKADRALIERLRASGEMVKSSP